MADLIDRDAAIDKMYGDCKSGYDGHCPHPYGMCHECESIWQTPKADITAVNRWIPCSERLPEDNQQCLIYRDIKVSNLKMTTGVYHADRQVFIGLRHGTELKDAIAWMPLPEPPESEVQE